MINFPLISLTILYFWMAYQFGLPNSSTTVWASAGLIGSWLSLLISSEIGQPFIEKMTSLTVKAVRNNGASQVPMIQLLIEWTLLIGNIICGAVVFLDIQTVSQDWRVWVTVLVGSSAPFIGVLNIGSEWFDRDIANKMGAIAREVIEKNRNN
jgi:hypothetical protein